MQRHGRSRPSPAAGPIVGGGRRSRGRVDCVYDAVTPDVAVQGKLESLVEAAEKQEYGCQDTLAGTMERPRSRK
jgi:hypothetical protein